MTDNVNPHEQIRREIASDLFMDVWAMFEIDRTPEEDDRLLSAAHAYCFHWGEIGTQFDIARANWLLSRTYIELDRPQEGLLYAEKCLRIAQSNDVGEFALACAYEAMARATNSNGRADEAKEWVRHAEKVAESMKDPDERETILSLISLIIT